MRTFIFSTLAACVSLLGADRVDAQCNGCDHGQCHTHHCWKPSLPKLCLPDFSHLHCKLEGIGDHLHCKMRNIHNHFGNKLHGIGDHIGTKLHCLSKKLHWNKCNRCGSACHSGCNHCSGCGASAVEIRSNYVSQPVLRPVPVQATKSRWFK